MSLVCGFSHGTWEGVSRYRRPSWLGGERERAERQKPRGVEYRRGARWRTGS